MISYLNTVDCTFNCVIKTKGLLKVTGSHVHCNVVVSRKRGTIETLLLRTTNRKRYMAYQIAAAFITLSDLQGHSPTASLRDFSYSHAAVDKLSSYVARRAVPLRQLSVLSATLSIAK